MKTVGHVLTLHAEESSFLWLLRAAAVHQPHYTHKDLSTLDNRIDAHLDGLRVAGDDGWQVCEKQLAWEEAGEFFTAGVLAIEAASRERFQAIAAKLEKAAEESPSTANGLISALGWVGLPRAKPHIEFFLSSTNVLLRRVGLAASAILRQHPGPTLKESLASPDPALRERALRAVGELGYAPLADDLARALDDKHPACLAAAAWSGTLLNVPVAVRTLRALAEQPGAPAAPAAALAARRLPLGEAHAWRTTLAKKPEHLRTAIAIAAATGDPAAITWLFPLMDNTPLARAAGEAFSMITGADLAYLDLERDPPEGFTSGPTEDAADEDVALDPDERLPWPSRPLIEKWWQANQSRFKPGERYLMGLEVNPSNLRVVLQDGKQRQRATAALELAIREPGPLANVANRATTTTT